MLLRLEGSRLGTPNQEKEMPMKIAHLLLALFALTILTTQASSQQVKTFAALNAGTSAETGTQPTGINALGTITGVMTDNNYGQHGFVLGKDSKCIIFDSPGADPTLPRPLPPRESTTSGK
jgi:hypothetical protein